MTNKEAIKRLKNIVIRDALQEDYDALGIAIEALKEQKEDVRANIANFYEANEFHDEFVPFDYFT